MLALLAGVVLLSPLAAQAKPSTYQETHVYIPREQTVNGNLYRAGDTIQIDGIVDGDVVVAGGTVKINGTVTGDVLAAGGRVEINGPVQGDIRIAGGDVIVNSVVGKNATVFAGSFRMPKEGAIGYEAVIFAGDVDIAGQIKKHLRGAAGQVILAGTVGQDVWMKADRLVLQPTSSIGGNLNYASMQAASVMSGAVVSGEVNYQAVDRNKQVDKDKAAGIAFGLFAGIAFVKVIGLWLLALLVIWMMPKKLEKSMHELNHGVWPAIGVGLLVLIGAPVAMIIVAMTIIGVHIALVMAALYLLLILSAKIVISTYVGDWLIKRVSGRHWRNVSMVWSSLLGIVLLFLVTLIPVLGWLISCFALALGVGAILMFERNEMRRWR